MEYNGAIEIIKLDKDLYLIGEKYQHANNLNYLYSVYDKALDELSEIGGIYQLIENIYLEDGKIIFKCNGKNSATSFLNFPDTYMYNLDNKKLKLVNDYAKFGEEYDLILVGGHHNATLLTEVEHNLIV